MTRRIRLPARDLGSSVLRNFDFEEAVLTQVSDHVIDRAWEDLTDLVNQSTAPIGVPIVVWARSLYQRRTAVRAVKPLPERRRFR